MKETRLFSDAECKKKAPKLLKAGVTEASIHKLYHPADAAVILATMKKLKEG